MHSTVSHYNLIHVSCHVAARRADAALRVAKKEWEGASLRNGNTLANNLLPVRLGPAPSSRLFPLGSSLAIPLAGDCLGTGC